MVNLPPPGHLRMQVVLTLPESLCCDIFQHARTLGTSIEQLLSDNLVEAWMEDATAKLALATNIVPAEVPAATGNGSTGGAAIDRAPPGDPLLTTR